MARIGTRAEVWFSNIVASFARYVAERTLPESVPMLMRRDAVMDSFNYAKENMQAAYSFLDRFDGLGLSIQEALRRFPDRKLVLEFGVFKAGMINHQAGKFPRSRRQAAEGPAQCRLGEGMVFGIGPALENRKSGRPRAAIGPCRL
jgi:hypothetical protein